MKPTTLALSSLFLLAACGGDSPTRPSAPNLAGYYASDAMWVIQFHREHDGLTGSFTCSGSLTLTESAASPNDPGAVPIGGFALVGSPCPAQSFDVAGTAGADGTVSFVSDGPRPPEGQCPAAVRAGYSGLVSSGTLSARTTSRIFCPGPGEGWHQFTYVITASRLP